MATRLTLGLIKSKLDEHGLSQAAELVEGDPEAAPLELGPFRVELVRVAHSIPDSVALVIETGAGRVVHTGDWKLDHTPVDGLKTDVGKLAEIGNRGVDLLLGDSTNAERPGSTGSERLVGEAFRTLFPLRRGRILVASFASNIHRMQQAADVAVESRPQDHRHRPLDAEEPEHRAEPRLRGHPRIRDRLPGRKPRSSSLTRFLALCTGSQGEPMSALTRIAYGDHPALTVEPGDTVIISAKPVPGNELRVHDSINQLARAGGRVLHEEIAPVHASGHACQEEPERCSLLRPRYVMPIHGEYRMLAAHAKLAREAGVPEDRIILADNGSVVELARGGARLVDQVDVGVTFVDGLRVGDVKDVALRDRRRLADDGVLIVVTTLASSDGGEIAPPELIARGLCRIG